MEWRGGFVELEKRAWWNYPNEHSTRPITEVIDGVLSEGSTSMGSSGGFKTDARSLRCVKVEN